MAQNSSVDSGAVAKEATFGMTESVVGFMGSRKNQMRMAQRARGNTGPKWPENPKTLAELDIPEKLKYLEDGVTRFVLYDSG